jgi:ketosteroid isomerase-like protein
MKKLSGKIGLRRLAMNTEKIDHESVIEKWIAAANAHDKAKYLAFFSDDAVLDDPSVGRKFRGRAGIGRYFDAYFIGYNTRTRLVSVEPEDKHLHVEVHFTGDFPGGKTGGIFDVTFKGDEISFVHADLGE